MSDWKNIELGKLERDGYKIWEGESTWYWTRRDEVAHGHGTLKNCMKACDEEAKQKDTPKGWTKVADDRWERWVGENRCLAVYHIAGSLYCGEVDGVSARAGTFEECIAECERCGKLAEEDT